MIFWIRYFVHKITKQNGFINNMKTSVSKFNNHSSLTYITKLLIISSSDAAVLNTTVPAIGFVGEVIKKLDDWIPESKNG